LEVPVELLVGNASLHGGIEIARADLQDPVHLREIEAHSATQRHDMAFQAGAGAKRDSRHLVLRTKLDDLAHLLGRLWEGDGVRRYAGMIGGISTVLLPHRHVGRQAIAQQVAQGCDGGIARGSCNRFDI